jgi:C1A family cysteine protease
VSFLAQGFYTVDRTIPAMKATILEHGPCYFRYGVYDDFYTHWRNGAQGSVYKQKEGDLLGGHAVLIIGWSDTKRAWLLKNSWGSQTGPNCDGTMWIAYTGHAQDLGIQLFNFATLRRTS